MRSYFLSKVCWLFLDVFLAGANGRERATELGSKTPVSKHTYVFYRLLFWGSGGWRILEGGWSLWSCFCSESNQCHKIIVFKQSGEFALFTLSFVQYHFNPQSRSKSILCSFSHHPYNLKKTTLGVFPARRWQILLLTVPFGIAAPRLEWSDQVRRCGGRWTGKRWNIYGYIGICAVPMHENYERS